MQPEHFYFGGGAADTVMLPIVAALLALTIMLTLLLPRRYVVAPFLISTFLIPQSQMLVVAGLHLFVFRIVLLFIWLRLAATKLSYPHRLFPRRFDTFDKVFFVWASYRAFAFVAVFHFQSAALINQAAFLLDVFGSYFLLRYLIQNDDDILRVIRVFAVISAIVGLCMLNEKLCGHNWFEYLGGPLMPDVRDGTFRARGSFAHAILAGTFGATLLPLFISLWKSGEARALSILGVCAATVMTITSSSSTPLMAYAAGIVSICCWPMRRIMRSIRWALAIALVSLHIVMKAPVWFLIERVSIVGGSSGYHRALLVDQFIRHFGEWWLIGTNANGRWGFDMWDLSNQFVAEGLTGGLVTFVCFVALISMCFSRIGSARKSVAGRRKEEWYLWFFGAALVAHTIGFFGISYFDRSQVSWLALLVMINIAAGTRLSPTALETRTRSALLNDCSPVRLGPSGRAACWPPPPCSSKRP